MAVAKYPIVRSTDLPDPYVPVDGTMNVTGGLTASAALTGASWKLSAANSLQAGVTAPTILDVNGDAFARLQLGYDSTTELWGSQNDAAGAVAVLIGAAADYTTAGTKLLSIRDNLAVSGSEKAYVDLHGDGVFAGGRLRNAAQAGALDPQFQITDTTGATTYAQFMTTSTVNARVAAPAGNVQLRPDAASNVVVEQGANFNLPAAMFLLVGVFSDANRGAAGTAGRVIFNTTDANLNIDNGTNWILPNGTVT